MHFDPRKTASAGLMLIVVTLVGCWGGPPGLVSVTGEVYLDNEPVESAAVMFFPDGPGRPAWAHTDNTGAFELTTFRNKDGAALGSYKVSVTKVVEEVVKVSKPIDSDAAEIQAELQGSRRKKREIWLVPQRYSDAKASGLVFAVDAGNENHAVLSLRANRWRIPR